MSLRKKVFFLTFFLTVVSFVIFILFFLNFSKNVLYREIKNHLLTLSQLKEKQIVTILTNYIQLTNDMANNLHIAEILTSQDKNELHKTERTLQRLTQTDKNIIGIYLVDKDSQIKLQVREGLKSSVTLPHKIDTIRIIHNMHPDIRLITEKAINYIEIVVPIFKGSNNTLTPEGVLIVQFSLKPIMESITELNDYWARGDVYLTNNDLYLLTPVKGKEPKDKKIKLPTVRGKPTVYRNYSDTIVLGVYRQLHIIPAYLIVEIPIKHIYRPVSVLTRYLTINYTAFSVFLLLLFLFFLDRLTKPLNQIMKAISGISKGNLNINLDIKTHDEFNKLAETFNQMVASIREAQEEIKNQNRELEKRVRERTRELYKQIEENKKIQKILEESEEKYRILSEQSIELIYWRNPEGKINFISPNCKELTGYSQEEFLNNPRLIEDIVTKDDADVWKRIKEAFHQRTAIINKQMRIQRKDGKTRWIRYSHTPLYKKEEFIGFRCTNTDIEEYKKLEEQFRQAQKMEAIGRLAGGVAHDFNNILTVIIGTGEMLLSQLSSKDPNYTLVKDILDAGKRAETLTHQLLAFSRRQTVSSRVINLNDLIKNVEKMLKRLIGENINLQTYYDENLLPIKADPTQVEQILFNLATNAKDAMPKGGNLTIQTENFSIESSLENNEESSGAGTTPIITNEQRDTVEKRYVLLTVKDTGIGMDSEILTHIFEPFFTTKSKGTGLGLATVYGIIKQMEGLIEVDSKPGKGTAFRIYFPVTTEEDLEETKQIKTQNLMGNNRTILLVEDEEHVRKATTQFLESYNYKVIPVTDPEEALKIFKNIERENSSPQIDLLITDIILPGMTGKELSDKILSVNPNTKILFTSGYNDEEIYNSGVLKEKIYFIPKPFTPEQLATKVREVLKEN